MLQNDMKLKTESWQNKQFEDDVGFWENVIMGFL